MSRLRRALLVAAIAAAGSACADLPSVQPLCDDVEPMALMAQSAPRAEAIPCMDEVPFGFRATTFDVGSDNARWHLSHRVAGLDVVRVLLDEPCRSLAPGRELDGTAFPPGEWVRDVAEDGDAYRADWVRRDEDDETCIVVTLVIEHEDWEKVLEEFEPAFRIVDRDEVAEALHAETDGRLDLYEHEDDERYEDGEEA